ncbi:hypothetical protein ACFL6I_16740 [candidate division KSB1 bacterium]
MVIEFDMRDIEGLLDGREYSFKLPVGAARLYEFTYTHGSMKCRLDYPSNQRILCETRECDISEDTLSVHIEIPGSRLTRVQLLLLTGIIPIPLSGTGMTLKYPYLSVDMSYFDLPVTPRKIDFLADRIRIEGELPKETAKS